MANYDDGVQTPDYQANQTVPVKKSSRIVGVFIALAAVVWLALNGVGGFYLYMQYHYGNASAEIASGSFHAAIKDLGAVPSFYRDAPKLMVYAQAGDSLQQSDFTNAKHYYETLGDYKDSARMVHETDYKHAKAMLDSHDFAGARSMFVSLQQYSDSAAMITETDYSEAQFRLAGGDYDGAKTMFLALAVYKDSADMVMEADYRKAGSLLAGQKFDDALALYQSLSEKQYKDSATLAQEVVYQNAKFLQQSGDLVTALDKISKVVSYKDAAAVKETICAALYDQAADKYRKGDYTAAESTFKLLGDYKQCANYLDLVAAHNKSSDDFFYDLDGMKALYGKLIQMGSFEDAAALKLSDAFIMFWLQGKWQDSSGAHYYLLMINIDGGADLSTDLPGYPGKYIKVENCIEYKEDDKGNWNKQFRFEPLSDTSMNVYCYKTDQTFTLSK